MDQNRRTFLKTTGAVGAVTATAGMALPTVPAQAAASPVPHALEMARGMTLVNMRRDGGFGLGVKTERGILDVTLAAQALNMPAPVDIDDLLQNSKGGMLKAVVDAAKASSAAERAVVPERGIEYAPAVTRPEKIIMMGFNYRKHAEETNTPIPKNPILFNKYNNALNCHGGTIKLPTGAATKFDYEVELVIVFGKECSNVSEEQALDYVAGYCTGNDFSARDLQFLTSQYMIGKSCDGFAPLGPYLVTSDLVGDPNNLRLECRVNGEQRQDWNTNDMIFNCRQLISFASKMMTIKPGDIFFTGTPQGVIAGKPKDQQVWLKPGDKIACSLEKLGELAFELT
ncbi:fumarylacetoacetate hydrolase family protein [Azospirillum canadense]|uniref:fumarylacetoacetate hydrolase family protein n=1 Tax=Azospirillum canadense TaxID=403962 RepID=UPI00222644D8|nr:fumarylacetoacetate hydrolase family protein [Azospirillum canadense]MCW2242413.1 2-keto-4-pentenoate hydratase/2-oxohepta-3-ene-1,7-dioic acid hydratase in catechol pathway [Azospirillum canadense]